MRVGKLLVVLGLLAAAGGCTSRGHVSANFGAPELCVPPRIQTVVSSKVADGTAYVHGPISNVGVVVGSPVAGSTLTSVRIDVVAGTGAAQSQVDVSQGIEKGVVVRKVFAAPTPGQELLVPFSSAASAGTGLAPGHYIAWEVDTYMCSLDTGSPEVKGSRSILADITVT
jgi:hypothetical protein